MAVSFNARGRSEVSEDHDKHAPAFIWKPLVQSIPIYDAFIKVMDRRSTCGQSPSHTINRVAP